MAAAAPSPSSTPTRDRLIAGDPLRAIAALGVFGIHAVGQVVTSTGYVPKMVEPDHFATFYGVLGHLFNGMAAFVGLFFALSGYLIARPFLPAVIEGARLPSIPTYLRNRALRIVPAFFVVFTAVLLIY